MSINSLDLKICWYAETVEHRLEFYKSSLTKDLIDILNDLSYYEEIPSVLQELIIRNQDISPYLKNIFESFNENKEFFLLEIEEIQDLIKRYFINIANTFILNYKQISVNWTLPTTENVINIAMQIGFDKEPIWKAHGEQYLDLINNQE